MTLGLGCVVSGCLNAAGLVLWPLVAVQEKSVCCLLSAAFNYFFCIPLPRHPAGVVDLCSNPHKGVCYSVGVRTCPWVFLCSVPTCPQYQELSQVLQLQSNSVFVCGLESAP